MSFADGAVSFRRFFIEGACPETADEDCLRNFQDHAFGKHGAASSDGIEFGWITPDHILDVDLTEPDRLVVDRFIHLSIRVDRTATPANVLKAYRVMEERAALAASGRDFLNSHERRAAREAAARRAELEARKGAFRRAIAYPVLIDLENKTVYLGSGGTTVGDRFISLMRDTLDVALVPASAEEVAYRIAITHGTKRSFEDVRPAPFVDSPAGPGEDVSYAANNRDFLGWEFLTWLLYRLDSGEGQLDLPGYGDVQVSIFKSMMLDCAYEISGSDTIRNDAPAATPEARVALAVGKTPRKTGLLMACREDQWQLNFDGPRFSVSSLVIAQLDEKDPVVVAEHRFEQIRRVCAALDAIYAHFLKIRFAQDWTKELAAVRHWISHRSRDSRARASA